MKYCVLIIDGAAGLPLAERGGRTSLELARTPNLDAMSREGTVGLVRTVPPGMEPSSACACLSILGYDPTVYYPGRAAIEARSMGIDVGANDVVFRCNLVAVKDGRMRDYSAGHITSEEAGSLIAALQESLGDNEIGFYPGIGYRHICRIKGHEDTVQAVCTPPHDIHDQSIVEFLPQGPGSELLNSLMTRSKDVLQGHSVNKARRSRGETEATMIWLFWGSRRLPQMPSFKQVYGLRAALTSGVNLLQGMAQLVGMDVLEIPSVTDGGDNDYAAQAAGALEALDRYYMVIVHIESPDEAAHGGSIEEKIKAIEMIDGEVAGRILSRQGEPLRALVLPDHPTPIALRTHSADPVPFLLWGSGFAGNGADGFSEAEAAKTGLAIEKGYTIMGRLIGI